MLQFGESYKFASYDVKYGFLLNHVQLSSLVALKDWVAGTDISNFLILLCVGNKVDQIPGHPVHAKYRKQLRKTGELGSFDNLSIEFDEYEFLKLKEVVCWMMKKSHCGR